MLKLTLYNPQKKIVRELEQSMKKNEKLLLTVQKGEAQYANSLGWLDTGKWADAKTVEFIEKLAETIRKDADIFVLIGVGGSNNAARSVIEALQKDGSPEILYSGNTLSPYALTRMLKKLEGKSVYIDCIAKNFETLEPGSSFRIIRKFLYKQYGQDAARRIIATGTRGSSLEKLCTDNGYTFVDFPPDIGGRYTAITNVGLLPMAVAGISIRELIQGAGDMQRSLRTEGTTSNSAYRYACLKHIFYNNGYKIEMLSSFEPQFRWFNKWWIQLFAESGGKDNKGIFPVAGEFSEELHSVGQFIQDGEPVIFETFLTTEKQTDSLIIDSDGKNDNFDYLNGKDFHDINQAAYTATIKAHSEKLPCMTIQIDRVDAYQFGQLFYFFQFACYLFCRLMGVNPFDQPGVEAYKKWMFEALGKN